MWGNMGLQQQPVAVRRRIAPPPAAAKLYMIVSDYADSQLIALVMDTTHRIMTVPVKHYTIREPGVRAVPILMMDFDPIGQVRITVLGAVEIIADPLAVAYTAGVDPQVVGRDKAWRRRRLLARRANASLSALELSGNSVGTNYAAAPAGR